METKDKITREMIFFVLQRRWVAIRLPRLTVMTSVIFCKLVKDFGLKTTPEDKITPR